IRDDLVTGVQTCALPILTDTPVEITVSLITPYAAYLPAELFGVSGVLAAVTAGLYIGRRSSEIMGSEARLAGRAVWESLVFLLRSEERRVGKGGSVWRLW